jgi:NAD+ synthase (glutamine-hydrolysing)
VDAVLQSVLDTEITPELVPTGEEEELRSSQAKVGPFALQDFSLFDVLRYGFRLEQVVH